MVETFRPTGLKEALEIRSRCSAIPFAGGTDLMVKRRRGAGALPDFERPVLFLDKVKELKGFVQTEGGVEIGAAVALSVLAENPLVARILRSIVLEIGAPALRNVATIGGNVCNASPAGDTLPFLYACEARLRIASLESERVVGIADFITGPGRIDIGPGEILRSILIPARVPETCHWRKVGTRKANALTKVSIAALAEVRGGRVNSARIALGAVAPTVVRLTEVEGMLKGTSAADLPRLSPEIRRLSAEAVRPIDDQRSTAAYRSLVAVNLVESFVGSSLFQ
jgi:xanthine dehydrogenase FAD-binding subunit